MGKLGGSVGAELQMVPCHGAAGDVVLLHCWSLLAWEGCRCCGALVVEKDSGGVHVGYQDKILH